MTALGTSGASLLCRSLATGCGVTFVGAGAGLLGAICSAGGQFVFGVLATPGARVFGVVGAGVGVGTVSLAGRSLGPDDGAPLPGGVGAQTATGEQRLRRGRHLGGRTGRQGHGNTTGGEWVGGELGRGRVGRAVFFLEPAQPVRTLGAALFLAEHRAAGAGGAEDGQEQYGAN